VTLLIGSEGSMGKRYQAILNFLDEPFGCLDPKLGPMSFVGQSYDRFIVATPTETHLEWIKRLDSFGKPILCEKPLAKNMSEVNDILACQSPLSMMMQYVWLVNQHAHGRSFYNYYNHGPDGLVWDCFQIVALAEGEVELAENSPVWRCTINGMKIKREDMDGAYVEFVRAWLKGAQVPKKKLIEWHRKVKIYEEKWNTLQSP
jgi:hypothetical protein